MKITFSSKAWEQYLDWQVEDKKVIAKINKLIKSIERDGLLKGIGKPESLKYEKVCSRRINDEHRLIYNLDKEFNLVIYACKGHYED